MDRYDVTVTVNYGNGEERVVVIGAVLWDEIMPALSLWVHNNTHPHKITSYQVIVVPQA